MMIWSCVT